MERESDSFRYDWEVENLFIQISLEIQLDLPVNSYLVMFEAQQQISSEFLHGNRLK